MEPDARAQWRAEGRVVHVFADGEIHDVFVWEGGDATAEPILLLAATGETSEVWADVAGALATQHRVHAVEPPPNLDGAGSVELIANLWQQLGVRGSRVATHGDAVEVASALVDALGSRGRVHDVVLVAPAGPAPDGVPTVPVSADLHDAAIVAAEILASRDEGRSSGTVQ